MRKVALFMGIFLVLLGFLLLVWYFSTNIISEKKMNYETEIFLETIVEPPPPTYLEGNTIGVLLFPTLNKRKVAIKEGSSDYILSLSAGHLTNTEHPWEELGTCGISAHNTTFFKDLN